MMPREAGARRRIRAPAARLGDDGRIGPARGRRATGGPVIRMTIVFVAVFLLATFPATWLLMLFLGNVGPRCQLLGHAAARDPGVGAARQRVGPQVRLGLRAGRRARRPTPTAIRPRAVRSIGPMSIVTGLPALPPLTTDLEQARADLDELGIARIAERPDARAVGACAPASPSRPPAERGRRGGLLRRRAAPTSGCGTCRARARCSATCCARRSCGRWPATSSRATTACRATRPTSPAPAATPMGLHTDQGYAPRRSTCR